MLGPITAGVVVAWGFSEATLFFVLPDVVITWLAVRRGVFAGLIAALLATVGTVAGGWVMYRWGATDPAGVGDALVGLPAIDRAMVDQVRSALAADWRRALFGGAFTGVPYKIFAAGAPQVGIALAPFLLVSIAARLARFASLALVAGVLGRAAAVRLSTAQRLAPSLPKGSRLLGNHSPLGS